MAGSTSKGSASSKKILDAIREATGASDEDIQMVLKECNGDVNEATARLIDSTWWCLLGMLFGSISRPVRSELGFRPRNSIHFFFIVGQVLYKAKTGAEMPKAW